MTQDVKIRPPAPARPDPAALYTADFYQWALSQGEALRTAAVSGTGAASLDYQNLAEEIEALAKRDRRELRNRLVVLLAHWLNLEWSAAEAPRRGWCRTVRDQRDEIAQILADSPSLRAYLPDVLPDCLDRAKDKAADEPDIDGEALAGAAVPPVERLLDQDAWPVNRFGLD